jgi:hypothetical protein
MWPPIKKPGNDQNSLEMDQRFHSATAELLSKRIKRFACATSFEEKGNG